jgi:hypothetical protein
MWVYVTQILPEGTTQRIEVNTDLIEDVQPWLGHTMLVETSGHTKEITETMEQWAVLTKEKS